MGIMVENYYCKFINFFKASGFYDKEIFNYIWQHSVLFNYLELENQNGIGIYYIFNKSNKLIDFKIVVPYIDSEITLFINIHEYMHAIDAYYKLGKKIKFDELCEVNSLLFENIYLSSTNNKQLEQYKSELDKDRIKSGDNKYILGLKIANELSINYNYGISLNKLNKKNKRLLKKYKYLG